MKRVHLVTLQGTCLFLAVLAILLGFTGIATGAWDHITRFVPHGLKGAVKSVTDKVSPPTPLVASVPAIIDDLPPTSISSTTTTIATAESTPTSSPVKEEERLGNATLYANASAYVKPIMDPKDESKEKMICPAINATRYGYLKAKDNKELKYFFAFDLRQIVDLLPRLLGSFVEAARFLGPEACALSIIEGGSDDGTLEVLDLLKPELQKLGMPYFLNRSDINPKAGDRINRLAALRNLALTPLETVEPKATADTTVTFFNDVAACPSDILELIHQRAFQDADMTCAMDWNYIGNDPFFYDVWVARQINGNTFFHIPKGGSWNNADNLFWDSEDSRHRFDRMLPFQVYACWNGGTVFTAAPILGLAPDRRTKIDKVTFRSSREGECFGGEPTLFCKDLIWNGFGRIAVVPSVNLAYTNERGNKIKKLKGFAAEWTGVEEVEATRIKWIGPPEKVRCMPNLGDENWRPWNETMGSR